MAQATRDEGKKVNSDINVTPMVDVMLVLLIIFMVVTPMLNNKVNVDLPIAGLAACGDGRMPARKMRVCRGYPRRQNLSWRRPGLAKMKSAQKISDKLENKTIDKRVLLSAAMFARTTARSWKRSTASAALASASLA